MEFIWFQFIYILWLMSTCDGATTRTDASRYLIPTVTKIWRNLTTTSYRKICSMSNQAVPTRFILYKRDQPRLSIAKANQKGRIFGSHLDPNNEVVIIVHEYLRGCNKPFTIGARRAYIQARPEVQVVTVCWDAAFPRMERSVGKTLSLLGYFPSTLLVPCVGDLIAKFLNRLRYENGVPWSNMTIATHSLGGQLAGDAGNKVGGKIETIIALDPAVPFYGDKVLLRKTSAKHVIVLHTTVGQFSMGTADFYANSLWNQPGCEKGLATVLTFNLSAFLDFCLCNHSRSFELFIESVLNPKAFLATRCDNYLWFEMGFCKFNKKTYFGPDTKANGTFYFTTKATKPYY